MRINKIIFYAFPPKQNLLGVRNERRLENVLGLKLNLNNFKTHEHTPASSRLVSPRCLREKREFSLPLRKLRDGKASATTTSTVAATLRTNFSSLIEI